MREVRAKVVSSRPIKLSKAAAILSRFSAVAEEAAPAPGIAEYIRDTYAAIHELVELHGKIKFSARRTHDVESEASPRKKSAKEGGDEEVAKSHLARKRELSIEEEITETRIYVAVEKSDEKRKKIKEEDGAGNEEKSVLGRNSEKRMGAEERKKSKREKRTMVEDAVKGDERGDFEDMADGRVEIKLERSEESKKKKSKEKKNDGKVESEGKSLEDSKKKMAEKIKVEEDGFGGEENSSFEKKSNGRIEVEGGERSEEKKKKKEKLNVQENGLVGEEERSDFEGKNNSKTEKKEKKAKGMEQLNRDDKKRKHFGGESIGEDEREIHRKKKKRRRTEEQD